MSTLTKRRKWFSVNYVSINYACLLGRFGHYIRRLRQVGSEAVQANKVTPYSKCAPLLRAQVPLFTNSDESVVLSEYAEEA
jgi:hypothetical protein